jgi:saccharopine dehydrogenase (NADP+, L-glutamate forming)
MGFLSDEEQSFLKEKIPWAEATQMILGASSSNEKDLVRAISSKVTFKDTEEQERLLAGLKWIGIFSSETIIPRGQSPSFFSLLFSVSGGLRWMVLLQMVPRSSVVFPKQFPKATSQRVSTNAGGIGNPLDTLCATLEKKMQFEEGERDLVMLQVSSSAYRTMSHFVSQGMIKSRLRCGDSPPHDIAPLD